MTPEPETKPGQATATDASTRQAQPATLTRESAQPDTPTPESAPPVASKSDDVRAASAASAVATAPPPPPAPLGAPPVVIPRWVQLVLLPLALLGLWELARASGSTLLIFLVAIVIALILNPLVKLLQAAGLPRGLAVAGVYVGLFVIFAASVGLLGTVVANQVTRFQHDIPSIVNSANHTVASVQRFLNHHGLHVQIQRQGETALQTLQRNLLKGSGSIISFTSNVLQQVVTVGFALILILVISIYLLLYGEPIGTLVRRVMPPGNGTDDDDYALLVQRAVSSYVRAQLLFSLVMGASAGLSLWILGLAGVFPAGRTYAVFFGVFYALMELVPYVGPILGAIPPVLVALFHDPVSAVWLVLLFLALQQLEGHIVSPQVFGRGLRINPILVIVALLLGGDLYGIVGALIALPVASVLRVTVIYLRHHLVLEPWGGPGLLAGPTLDRCVRCESPLPPADAFCRVCGAPRRSTA